MRCATACCTTGWPAPKLLGRPYWGTHDNAAGQKSMVLLRAIHDKSNNALIGSLFLGVRPSHFGAVFDVSLGAGSAMFVVGAIPLATLASEARSVRDRHVLIGVAALLAAPALALGEARRSAPRSTRCSWRTPVRRLAASPPASAWCRWRRSGRRAPRRCCAWPTRRWPVAPDNPSSTHPYAA